MKTIIPQLVINQNVWAIVEEIISQNSLIVSFQGDLIRVENKSGRSFRPGQRIQLKVVQVHPLEFKLLELQKIRSDTKINITV